jgi:hypothetical protein
MGRLPELMLIGLFGISVRYSAKTVYDTKYRTTQIQKPKPNRITKKNDFSVRFGAVRFLVYGKKVPSPANMLSYKLHYLSYKLH